MKINEMESIVNASKITKRNGIFTFRRSYFYTNGYDSQKFLEYVEGQLMKYDIQFETIKSGDVWKNFKGGAPIEKQSHWYVKVRVTDAK